MPYTFPSPVISNTNIKVRWKEQYGSAAFNQKFAGVINPGIYRGFIMGTSVSDNSITVAPDPTYQDHVCVCESADGFSTTYRDSSNTTYTLALTDSSLLSQTVVVTFFITYEEGQTTAGAFTGYTLAEYNALSASVQNELVILGTVVNPAASNLITAADITDSLRTDPRLSSLLSKTGVGTFTIGNGTTCHGDFDTSNYPTMDLMFTAIFAAAPSDGARIWIKPGVNISNFNGNTVSLPANATYEFIGDHTDTPINSPQITFSTGEYFICSGSGKLILRNIHIRTSQQAVELTTSPCWLIDVFAETTATLDTYSIFFGTNISDLYVRNLKFNSTSFTGSIAAVSGFGIRISGTCTRIDMQKVYYNPSAGFAGAPISLADIRNNILLRDMDLQSSQDGACLFLNTTDNVTQIQDRLIEHISCSGSSALSIQLGNCGWITINQLMDYTAGGMEVGAWSGGGVNVYTGAGPIRFTNCLFTVNQSINGSFPDLRWDNCTFDNCSISLDASYNSHTQGNIVMSGCTLEGANAFLFYFGGGTIDALTIEDCDFYGIGAVGLVDGNSAQYCVGCYGSTSVGSVTYQNNRVRNYMNLTYSGANTNTLALFAVQSQFAGSVQCVGNSVTEIVNTATGADFNQPYLLFCTSGTATSSNNTWGTVSVRNNTVGDTGSYIGLLGTSFFMPSVWEVANNTLTATWTGTGTPFVQFAPWIACQAHKNTGGGTVDVMRIDNNQILITADATKLAVDIFKQTTIQAVICQSFSFSGNRMTVLNSNSAGPWNYTTAFGLHTPSNYTIGNLIVWGNMLTNSLAVGPSTMFQTDLQGTVDVSFPSLPGSGSQWADNLNLSQT